MNIKHHLLVGLQHRIAGKNLLQRGFPRSEQSHDIRLAQQRGIANKLAEQQRVKKLPLRQVGPGAIEMGLQRKQRLWCKFAGLFSR